MTLRTFVILHTLLSGAKYESKYEVETLINAEDKFKKMFPGCQLKCIHEFNEAGKYLCSHRYDIDDEEYSKEVLKRQNTTLKKVERPPVGKIEKPTVNKYENNTLQKFQIKTNIPCKIVTKRGMIISGSKIMSVDENKIIIDDYDRTQIEISEILSLEYEYLLENEDKMDIRVQRVLEKQKKQSDIKVWIYVSIVLACSIFGLWKVFFGPHPHLDDAEMYSKQAIAEYINKKEGTDLDEFDIDDAVDHSENKDVLPTNIYAEFVHDWYFVFIVDGKKYKVECFFQEMNDDWRDYQVYINDDKILYAGEDYY